VIVATSINETKRAARKAGVFWGINLKAQPASLFQFFKKAINSVGFRWRRPSNHRPTGWRARLQSGAGRLGNSCIGRGLNKVPPSYSLIVVLLLFH
jgi:hypothetical protein